MPSITFYLRKNQSDFLNQNIPIINQVLSNSQQVPSPQTSIQDLPSLIRKSLNNIIIAEQKIRLTVENSGFYNGIPIDYDIIDKIDPNIEFNIEEKKGNGWDDIPVGISDTMKEELSKTYSFDCYISSLSNAQYHKPIPGQWLDAFVKAYIIEVVGEVTKQKISAP